MKRKELFYAVIGGCFGAAITMLVGLFTPIKVDAQSQPFPTPDESCNYNKVLDFVVG